MDLQLPNFHNDILFIEYFVIIFLCIEIGVNFLIQKLARRQGSPAWVLSFTAIFGGLAIYFLADAFLNLFAGAHISAQIVAWVGIFIIDGAGSIVAAFLVQFFRQNKSGVLTGTIILLSFCIATMFYHITAIFISATNMSSLIFILIPLSPIVIFPLYMAIKIMYHAETWVKRLFSVAIAASMVVLVIGVIIFPNVQEFMSSIFPAIQFSNLLLWLLLVALCAFAMIAGIFYYLPPVDDFMWIDELTALYILHVPTKTILYKQFFDEQIFRKERAEEVSVMNDENEKMLLGGLGGITQILAQLISSENQKLEYIDQGPIKLILNHEENVLFILFTRHYLPVLKSKLEQFKQNFMLLYGDLYELWCNETEKFKPVDDIVAVTFNTKKKGVAKC
jgi:hypothetical protein